MNTEQLRYFVSVARYRNFTETAREFYVCLLYTSDAADD